MRKKKTSIDKQRLIAFIESFLKKYSPSTVKNINIAKRIMITLLKRRYIFSPLILIITIALFPSLCFPDANKIFKENNKAVVVVVSYDDEGNPIGLGSGFIVRKDGAIVTNYHVVSNAEDIEVKAGENVLKIEGILHMDKENDIVILKAKAKELPVVKIGDAYKAEVGDTVYVIGSPKGLENTVSDGILSGIREIDPKRKILQITAPVSEGNSGSPVFNKNGEVIGIATFLIKEAQNLNFAMPINLIKDKISAKKVIAFKEAGIEDYKKTAEYWFILGCYYGETGLYEESIEAYKQAIKIKPDLVEAHYNLGVAYYSLGMYREAVEVFKQAIRTKPDLAEAHYNLGVAYTDLGMYSEAIEAYKQAIRLKPDYAKAHNNLGLAYANLSMHKEAIAAYKQAIRIKPDFAEAHNNLGATYKDLRMYREAVESCKQAIRIKPDLAIAHNNLGATYTDLRMYREAVEVFKQAIRTKPDLVEAHYNLGVAYYSLGMYREAVEVFKQAIRVKPDYAEAHLGLGVAYGYLGMYKEAMEAFKQAIRIKPDYALAHFWLGGTYFVLNDRGSALEEYKILKNLDSQLANKLFNSIYK